MPSVHDSYPQVEAPSRAAWRSWLTKHHATSKGIWLVFYKKASGVPSVAYAEAVEEALCFGWIDSRLGPLDETRYRQVFTPRKPQSEWSALNKRRVEALQANGLLKPAGRKAIAVAQANGSWSKIDHVEAGIVPEELRNALARSPIAKRRFDGFSPSTRKYILHWINNVKTPEKRLERIRVTVQLARRGLKANDPRDRAKLTKAATD
jgi:uncharacterized protein YdeI (YjbR/CyaY-like superfamily)